MVCWRVAGAAEVWLPGLGWAGGAGDRALAGFPAAGFFGGFFEAAANAGVVEVELVVFVAGKSCSRVMKKASSPLGVESRNIESLAPWPLEIRGTQPSARSQLPTPSGSH